MSEEKPKSTARSGHTEQPPPARADSADYYSGEALYEGHFVPEDDDEVITEELEPKSDR